MFIVITGGPCVGKTTIIEMLRERGFPAVDEIASQVISEGKILPWVDRDGFQREVLKRQLKSESALLKVNDYCFLDRGAFDGEAYYLCDALPVPQDFDLVDPSRYSLVFLLEDLGHFQDNGIRFENIEFTRRITPVIERCYEKRGIPVVRVPAVPPDERLEFVMEHSEGILSESRISARWAARSRCALVPAVI